MVEAVKVPTLRFFEKKKANKKPKKNQKIGAFFCLKILRCWVAGHTGCLNFERMVGHFEMPGAQRNGLVRCNFRTTNT